MIKEAVEGRPQTHEMLLCSRQLLIILELEEEELDGSPIHEHTAIPDVLSHIQIVFLHLC